MFVLKYHTHEKYTKIRKKKIRKYREYKIQNTIGEKRNENGTRVAINKTAGSRKSERTSEQANTEETSKNVRVRACM